MVTDSRPAGRSTSAKPQATATIPPPTVNASRTTGRAGSIISTPEAEPVYKMGGTSRIAIREPRGARANQLHGRRLSPLPPRRSSVTFREPCRSTPVPPLDPRSDPMRSALSLPVVVALAKELLDKELLAMADDITRHPEPGWKEERSVKILTDYLTAHGFDVEPGVAGLKTAFVARDRRGTPGPNVGVIVEYDALRGTSRDFHG